MKEQRPRGAEYMKHKFSMLDKIVKAAQDSGERPDVTMFVSLLVLFEVTRGTIEEFHPEIELVKVKLQRDMPKTWQALEEYFQEGYEKWEKENRRS